MYQKLPASGLLAFESKGKIALSVVLKIFARVEASHNIV
jgi:hypothetical protein